ncbi:hypothetical protein, partial [uncultured Dialister sp.]|uniref:hypothetical protein n=1 Tax=uncultured Dialister sp. TaxID=278064 RepID=UPI0026287668
VFKESSLFKRLDYLTTIRCFLSSTFLKFLKGYFIVAAALAATGMMIPWMGVCVNWFFEIFLHACGVRVQRVQEGSEGSEGKVDGADSPEGYGRLPAAGCVRFAQGATAPPALRVVVSPCGR